MAIYSEFSHKKWWFSIAILVYQRVNQKNCIRKYGKHWFLLKKGLPASVLFNRIWQPENYRSFYRFLAISNSLKKPISTVSLSHTIPLKSHGIHGILPPFLMVFYHHWFGGSPETFAAVNPKSAALVPFFHWWVEACGREMDKLSGREHLLMGYENVGNPGYHKQPAGLEMGRVKTAFSCDWQEVNHAFRSVFSCFYVVHAGQFYCDFEFSLGFTVYSWRVGVQKRFLLGSQRAQNLSGSHFFRWSLHLR